ncbi:MAG: hypothetical protein ACE363_06935 [Alphaproteobacteria bacterium]
MTDAAKGGGRTLWTALGLWLLVTAVLVTFNAQQLSAIDLTDGDDYMRLLQVERWLDNGGWDDLKEPRLYPPSGVTLHWSRLADIPIAATIGAARLWMDDQGAATAGLIIVPAVYFLAYLLLIGWITTHTIGTRYAPLAIFLAVLALPAAFQFMPGRIDHHGLQILLALGMLYALIRLFQGASGRWAVLLGAFVALALAIGVESLPQVIGAYAALAIGWIAGRDGLLRQAAVMAVTATAFTAVLLLIAVPQNAYFTAACDSFSLAYGSGIAAVAGSVIGLWLFADRLHGPARRAGAAVAALALVTAVMLWAYPGCLEGPYAALPEDVRAIWLENVVEARNVLDVIGASPFEFATLFLLPVTALFITGRRLLRSADQPYWLPLFVVLAIATVTSLVQIRGASVANAIAVVGAAPFYWAVFQWTTARLRILPLLAAVIAILAVSPPGMMALDRIASTGAAAVPTEPPCLIPQDMAALNQLERGIVIAPPNLGPVILTHSDHAIIAANYHRNVDGIRDAIRFFHAESDEEALAHARKTNAGYVAFCRAPAGFALPGLNNKNSLSYRISEGMVPSWLQPVEGSGRLVVFRVAVD